MTADYRKIIHLDLDAFFCAVEEQHDPELRGKPFAVGGNPEGRGVVASCSYKARQYGIRSAMPMARAIKLCPALIIRQSKHSRYGEKSKEVMKILKQFTAQVEQISIDEAFLDVSQDPRRAKEIGLALQKEIQEKSGLSCSLGISTNKLIAKIATDVGKAGIKTDTYPNAIQIVPPSKEAQFIAPLPTRILWGVGKKAAERLTELGIHTIGDIANWPAIDMERHFGKLGLDLVRRARGIDERSVHARTETKSISQEVTFGQDVMDENRLLDELHRQAKSVERSLRRQNLRGSTIKLKLRWPDFTTITRQITLPNPTNNYQEIHDAAKQLFHKNWKKGTAIRLLGVGISGFHKPNPQLNLWDAPRLLKNAELEHTLAQIKKRFGDDVIRRGIDD